MKTVFARLKEDGILKALKSSDIFRFFICNLLYSINLWLTIAYYPVYFNRLGMSDNKIGILISSISFVTLIFVFPFGIMSDRFRPKTLLKIGAIVLAVSNGVVILSDNYYYISGVVIVGGIGSTLFIITLYSLFYKKLDDTRRGVRIALFTFGAALGFGIGPFTGGFVIKYSSIENVFILAGIMNIILFGLVFTLKSSQPIKFHINMYRKDLLKPEVLLVVIIVFVMSTHFGVEKTCLALFMTKKIGLDGFQVGTVFMCVGMWIAALNLVAGHSLDKTRKLALFVALSVLVSGGFQVYTAYADSFASLLSIRLAHTIGDAFFLVVRGILITIVFPNKRMGGNFGFIYAVNTAAITVASLLSGFLSDRYGYGFPFMINGIIVVMLAVSLLIMKNRVEKMLICHETR